LFPPTPDGDPNNVERRIWCPERTGHLVAGQERMRGEALTSLELLLLSADFIRAIIQRAQRFADLIDKSPKFRSRLIGSSKSSG